MNDLKDALKEQYHAGLDMLAECVEGCPADLWIAPCACPPDPNHIIVRSYWRIAFHTVYFTHLYLGQNEEAFHVPPQSIALASRPDTAGMWARPWDLEPYEMPEGVAAATQVDVLQYIVFVDSLVDTTVDGLDLKSPTTGFYWYKNMGKLSHQLMNLRHIQGHVGQLSELLMARGIDIRWVAKAD